MSSGVEKFVVERIIQAPVVSRPFPHFFVEDVFPAAYYARLLANMPSGENFVSLGDTGPVPKGAYKDRLVLMLTDDEIAGLSADKQEFWRDLSNWLLAGPMFLAMCRKYDGALKARFGDDFDKIVLFPEALAVRDRTDYAIGPHTDAMHRFLSALFYCPKDDAIEHLGTSLYEPVDRGFQCPGGAHYDFAKFVNVGTMPFRPNSMFCFLKTDNSFHGVEPIRDQEVERDMILYDIRFADASKAASR